MVDPAPDSATVESITPAELKAQMDADEDVFLLDVRSPADFEEWHISGESVTAENYPVDRLMRGIDGDLRADLPEDRPVTVVCAKGQSSQSAAALLDRAGYDVNHLEYGMEGWAQVYEFTELDVDIDATVGQYRRPSSGCLAYLVASEGEAAIIDPLRVFTDRYETDLEKLDADLTYALDTHIHADHVSGVRDLAAETGATAVLPEPAADRGVAYDHAVETLTDGETITVGDVTIEAIHTPGHTTGMTTYAVGDVLFTGDGLFTESVARPDLEDPAAARDAAETLYETIEEKLSPHADDTLVAPGHASDGAKTTSNGAVAAAIGTLREDMDALEMDKPEFVDYIVEDMPPRPANYEEIIATNLGEHDPNDHRAFQLELGPNNCAATDQATN
jgi:glyoxylase-like metal-dependent hydrolase (beta-lactamase superfamily II)